MTVRILFIQHHTGVGGATRSLIGILETLPHELYEITVLFTGQDGATVTAVRQLGVRVVLIPRIVHYGHGNGARPQFGGWPPAQPITRLFRVVPSIYRVSRFVRQNHFDIVYINSSILIPAILGCRMAGIAPVVHVREMLYWGHWGIRFRLFRWLLENCASHLVVLSLASQAQFTGKTPTTVVYNAVDLTQFKPADSPLPARLRLGLPKNKSIILMMGGSLPHKGAHILVRAIDLVRQHYPDILVVILGFSPETYSSTWRGKVKRLFLPAGHAKRLKQLVSRLELDQWVRLEGPSSNVPLWIAASDLCVFPATEDHFPRPVIEAAAMRVPSIVSDGPTARELITDGVDGRLVPHEDPNALSEAIIDMLSDKTHLAEMGDNAYTRALECYDIQIQWQKIHALLIAIEATDGSS